VETGLYFEEYGDGWTFETESATILEAHVCAFVQLHGFKTPTYTNPAYMQAAYGGRMVPGMLVMCTAEGLVMNAGVTRRRGIFLMELTPKFKKPVYAGDTVVNCISFKSKRLTSRSDRGVVVTSHQVITNRGNIAIEYDSVRMIRTRLFKEPAEQAVLGTSDS
jgi:acyl dehydratase